MLHIFPKALEGFAKAMASRHDGEEHQFHVWGESRDAEDLFDDWDYLEKLIRPGGIFLYSAAIHQEGFGQWICKYKSLFSLITVVGVIAHGAKDFQAYSLLGCLRFCQEEKARVMALLGREHEDKLEYYLDHIGFRKHGIPVNVVDAQPARQGKKAAPKVVEDPHAPKVNTLENAVSPTSRDYFTVNRAGGIDEVVARGEIWENWEEEAPHSMVNAHWAGFPIYMNPGDLLLVGNIVQWWKPQLVVEVNAWKLGLTAFLLQVTRGMGTRIVAINSPMRAEKDAAWAKKLSEQYPEDKERVNLLHIHPDDDKGVLEPYATSTTERIMYLVNCHTTQELVGCARMIFRHTSSQSVAMFHATSNRDVPKFLKDFRRKPGIRSANIRFNPPGGSWYQGGVFMFDKASASSEDNGPSTGGVY